MNKAQSRYGSTLRIYDNGGKTFDRFTVMPPRQAKGYRVQGGLWECIGASSNPFDPQGFGQHTTAAPGAHLGKRIHWDALPEDVRKFAKQAFPEFARTAQESEEIETIARHYIIAALWADAPEGTNPRATAQAVRFARDVATRFYDRIGPDVMARIRTEAYDAGYGKHSDCGDVAPWCAALGHDLYLSTSGHGVGFFDRMFLPDDLREYLSSLCGWGTEFPEPQIEFYRGWMYIR